MLESEIEVQQDLFRRFGPARGELSLRDQLTEISEEHCQRYTRMKLQNQATGDCLALDREGHESDGGRLITETCADTPEQEWKLIDRPGGNVKLQNQATGRCYAIDGERHDSEGAPVTSVVCSVTFEQEWGLTLLSNGSVKLQDHSPGLCLAIDGERHDSDGAPVTGESCADTPAQEWKLLPKSTGRSHRIYEAAGSDDFFIRPVTTADHCVDDVVRAFKAIDFGRSAGENFYSKSVGRADEGPFYVDHMQGVARLPDGWLVQSNTGSVFLTYFPAFDGFGHQVWRVRPERVANVFPELPDEHRKHVGGVHAYGNIVVVPSNGDDERRVELFRHDSGTLHHLSTFVVSEYQDGPSYASILPLAGDDWLLAVGRDSREEDKPHRVYFYVIPNLTAEQDELRYLGYWARGPTLEDFQSLSLLADCTGRVFLIGTGVRKAQSNAHAKLYEVMSFSRSDGEHPGPLVKKIAERSPDSERNDCNLNAGATFFPTADEALAMYCTEKEIKDAAITTREYRNEDG